MFHALRLKASRHGTPPLRPPVLPRASGTFQTAPTALGQISPKVESKQRSCEVRRPFCLFGLFRNEKRWPMLIYVLQNRSKPAISNPWARFVFAPLSRITNVNALLIKRKAHLSEVLQVHGELLCPRRAQLLDVQHLISPRVRRVPRKPTL